MALNILLIASEMDNQKKYLSLLKDIGADITAVASFKNLDRSISENSYHGLMVDFNTQFKAVKENRDFVYRVMENFPVVLLRLDKEKNKIKAFYRSGTKSISLEDFIFKKCFRFKGRRFRYHERKPLHFNVTVSRNRSMIGEECQRSSTLNVSRGGCFVFSTAKWEHGDEIWMTAKEMQNNSPARGEVRYVVPWGTVGCVAGIGIELTEISEAQKYQLQKEFGI
jgi:hypothetical protein